MHWHCFSNGDKSFWHMKMSEFLEKKKYITRQIQLRWKSTFPQQKIIESINDFFPSFDLQGNEFHPGTIEANYLVQWVELYVTSYFFQNCVLRRRRRFLLLFEVWAGVHAEASSAAAEAVSLRSKLASVTDLAVQNVIVHVGVGGVQHLVAHTAFVTFLMEGDIAYHPGFGVVHRLAALGAFGVFGGLERHDCGDGWPSHGQTLKDG